MEETEWAQGDLGDLVVLLLAGTLSGLRDRLSSDGYDRAAMLVNSMVMEADAYLQNLGR
jgi:hypothetical protein